MLLPLDDPGVFPGRDQTSSQTRLHGLHCATAMSQPGIRPIALSVPKPVLELCAHLEERGIRSFSHGEGLLDDLRIGAASSTRSLICAAAPETLLRALPRAVVTAEAQTRITQATSAGPVDLICLGERNLPEALLDFGLGPFAFAYRPADASWIDPIQALGAYLEGRLELAGAERAPFVRAPRRFWIAARLIAERGLVPSEDLLAAARESLPGLIERLPRGAPARREISRILASADPGPALRFLRTSGVSALVAPGTQSGPESRIARLPAMPALRWAAWLRGGATATAMIRLRVPHRLARRIERLQAAHPIDRLGDDNKDTSLRRLVRKCAPEEIDALFAWRRAEIAQYLDPGETAPAEARLALLADQIEQIRSAEARSGHVRALAFDGRAVMETLGGGPGRHVGEALAHLAQHVADNPEANEPAALEAETREWARRAGIAHD